MIVNPIPRIRAPYAPALAATPHLHEGKFARLNANGQIELASSAEEAQGIITEPDSFAAAQAGNEVGASLLYRTFGGIVEVQLGEAAGAIEHGTRLSLAADGTVSPAEGTAVAMALEAVAAAPAGQLLKAILI